MAKEEPGDPGSTQGQIKTPMCSENVSGSGEGKVHDYKTASIHDGGSGNSGITGPAEEYLKGKK